jgi:hypothetical protein
MKLRRTIGMLAALLVAATAALGAAGCGSEATLDPVAQAAQTTEHAGGMQVALQASVSLGGMQPIALSGRGSLDLAAREGQLLASVSGLPAGAAGGLGAGGLQATILLKGDALYVSSPVLAGKLPGGAQWLRVDVAHVQHAAGLPSGTLGASAVDPTQFLSKLRMAGGHVTIVGRDTVRGVPTTHYEGHLDVSQALHASGGAGAGAGAQAQIGQLLAQIGLGSVPVEAWVDAEGRLRKLTIEEQLNALGQSVGLDVALECFGFGSVPPVTVPPAGEVYEATPQSLQGLGLGIAG